jgi:hypothetical protein
VNVQVNTPPAPPKRSRKRKQAKSEPAASVPALFVDPSVVAECHKNQYPPELTRRKQGDLLRLLAETGRLKAACQAVGIDPSTPFQWANNNPNFAKKLDEARMAGEKVLLCEYEEDLDQVVANRKYITVSGNLRMFRMKRLDPRYKDSNQVNVQVNGPAAIQMGVED